jgi:hypothetical protein
MPTQPIAELDAALIAIDQQRAAAVMPPAPTPEQIEAETMALKTYQRLQRENPFAAIAYCQRHQHSIYRAMAREDSTGPARAIEPRRTARRI